MTDLPATDAARAHFVLSPTNWLGGCSDVGLKHKTNQDAFCLAVRESQGSAILAVADGVSTASGAEGASRAASDAACAHLMGAFEDDQDLALPMVEAFHAAHDAVLTAAGRSDPSACTLVMATVQGDTVTVGNIGDSRAYWMGDDGTATLLTVDDSMAQARILLGMPREDAERSHQAHSITRWLGRDSEDVRPSLSTLRPSTPGWLLLCSDGLWNYASSADDLARVIAPLTAGEPTAAALAEALVAWARDRGGRDNITAALARLGT